MQSLLADKANGATGALSWNFNLTNKFTDFLSAGDTVNGRTTTNRACSVYPLERH